MDDSHVELVVAEQYALIASVRVTLLQRRSGEEQNAIARAAEYAKHLSSVADRLARQPDERISPVLVKHDRSWLGAVGMFAEDHVYYFTVDGEEQEAARFNRPAEWFAEDPQFKVLCADANQTAQAARGKALAQMKDSLASQELELREVAQTLRELGQ